MNNGQFCVGIDIGGTKVNIGIIDNAGNVLAKTKIASGSGKSNEDIIKSIAETVRQLVNDNNMTLDDIKFFGVGVPGTASIETGLVDYCPNLGWKNVPAGEMFLKYLGREVKVVQDTRAAALAELLYGAGSGFDNIVCVTLGTGIGSGVIINKKLFHGGMNTAGEVGHAVIVKGGRLCSCGNHGCLERYSSGSGILEQALERFPQKFEGKEKRGELVFELAQQGDAEALGLIQESVDYLALGIANMVSILSPQAVIISGGMCEHEELIINPLKELVPKHGYYPWAQKNELRIMKAQLGSDAPMIGASSLYLGM